MVVPKTSPHPVATIIYTTITEMERENPIFFRAKRVCRWYDPSCTPIGVVGYARVDPWDECLSHSLVDLVDQSTFGEEPLLDIMPIAEVMLGIGGTQKLHGSEP